MATAIPVFTPGDENAAAGKLRSGTRRASARRAPLGNISNKPVIGRAPPPKDSSALKPMNQQNVEQQPRISKKRLLSRIEDKQYRVSLDQERKAEAWGKEGIERVHFTGDEMEALRKNIEHEEMEKRVKAVISFRTEIFPAWPRSLCHSDSQPFECDGTLRLDSVDACDPSFNFHHDEARSPSKGHDLDMLLRY